MSHAADQPRAAHPAGAAPASNVPGPEEPFHDAMGDLAGLEEPGLDELEELEELEDLGAMHGFDDLDELDELAKLDELDELGHFNDLDDLDDFDDPDESAADGGQDPLRLPPDEEADERLGKMLERLEAAIPEGTPTVWVRILRAPRDDLAGGAPSEAELGPEKIEIDRRLHALIGYVAPPECIAIAIVGVGRAHHFEPTPGTRGNRSTRRAAKPAGEAARKPIDVPPGGMSARALCLMERSGRMAGRTWLGDGTLIPAPPETGRLVDAMRRCFGLPTAPAEFPAGELIGRLWLANVLAAGEEGAVTLGWKQVRELHPSAEALRAVGVPLTGTTLDRAREVAAMAWTWPRLRQQAIEGDWLPALVDRELAKWMDEGMFSRWVLEGTRTTAELLEMVTPWVAPSVRTKLARAVGR